MNYLKQIEEKKDLVLLVNSIMDNASFGDKEVIVGKTYEHKNNKFLYVVDEIITSEHPDNGKWQIAVLYHRQDLPNEHHSRMLYSFVNSFTIVND